MEIALQVDAETKKSETFFVCDLDLIRDQLVKYGSLIENSVKEGKLSKSFER